MYWSEFITIAFAHLLAVASPGPDFAVVLKQSVTGGTRQGILTSLGVGAGILIHVSYCLLGMSILLAQSDVLLTVMKYLAASYLAYLGVQAITASSRHRPAVESNGGRVSFLEAFRLGFLTNGFNSQSNSFLSGIICRSH